MFTRELEMFGSLACNDEKSVPALHVLYVYRQSRQRGMAGIAHARIASASYKCNTSVPSSRVPLSLSLSLSLALAQHDRPTPPAYGAHEIMDDTSTREWASQQTRQ